MDARWILTRAYGEPSQEERERPEFWRYWRDLPGNGELGIFLSAWYSQPLLDRVYGRISDSELDDRLERILSLRADPRELRRGDPQVLDAPRPEAPEEAAPVAGEGSAPVLARDEAGLEALEEVRRLRLRRRAHHHADEHRADAVGDHRGCGPALPEPGGGDEAPRGDQAPPRRFGRARERRRSGAGAGRRRRAGSRILVLSSLDLTKKLPKKDYARKRDELQARLNLLQREARDRKMSAALVFEGWDAAGKGGAIRRITPALDARDYKVIQIAAPSDEEKAHHYLWRFWRHLSRSGRFTIFDRSWYGRVLVERVEGFATEMRVAARLRGDQRLRAAARGPRHRAREVLASHLPGGAGAPLPGPRRDPPTSAGSSPTRTGGTARSGAATRWP